MFSTIFPFLNEIKNTDKVGNNSALKEDEKLVLKNNAINLIQENLSEATKVFNSQNLGAITSAYDEHKNEDDKLKTSNVKKVLDYQEQGMHFLIEARDNRLTRRNYYLKNKEHLKEMLITRINVLNIQDSLEFWDSTGKKLSKEDVIDAVDFYIDHICKNLELNKLKELQKGFVSYSTTRETEILKDFIQKAVEEKELNSNTSQLLDEGRGGKLKTDEQTMPEYWDSDETISFEEVYKFERGVAYSPEKIKNYMCAKTTMEIIIKAHNQKQQFEKEINLLKDNKTLTTQQKIEKLQNLYEEIYAVQEGLADKKLAQLVKQSNSLIKYTNNSLDFSAYPNEETQQKALNKLFEVALKEKEKEFTSFMKNKSIDDYQNIFEEANNEALGKENAMLLATAMKNDNMTVIDRYTGKAAMASVGLSIVGGFLCGTPLALLGAVMVTVGNTVALTSMGTSAVAEIADYKTKDFVTEEDTIKLIDGLIMDAGGMVIGYGAGKVGLKAFNKLIDKKLAASLGTNFKNGNRIEALKMVISNPNNLKNFLTAGGAKISSDFLISYIGDLAISGALGIDDDWESLLRANLIGIVVGTSNDLKAATGAKFKILNSDEKQIKKIKTGNKPTNNPSKPLDINNPIYEDIPKISEYLHTKMETQMRVVKPEEISTWAKDLSIKHKIPEQEVLNIMLKLTQFGSYSQLKKLGDRLSNLDVWDFYSEPSPSANTVLNYIAKAKKQFDLTGRRKAFILDDAGLQYIEKLDAAQKQDFKDKVENGDIVLINLDGTGLKIGNKYFSYTVLDGNQNLKAITEAVITQLKKGKSLDDVINNDYVKRVNVALGTDVAKKIETIQISDKATKDVSYAVADQIKPNMPTAVQIKATIDSYVDNLGYRDREASEVKTLLAKYVDNMLKVYSNDTMAEMLKNKHSQIEEYVTSIGKSMDDVIYVFPERLKSFELIDYMYAKVNDIDYSKFVNNDGLTKLPEDKVIVLLDDVVGSGHSMLRDVFHYDKFLNENPNSIVIFSPIICAKRGRNNIENAINNNQRNQRNDKLLYDKKAFIDFQEFLNKLTDEEKQQIKKAVGTNPMGYSQSALCTAFPWMIPDNNAYFSGYLLNFNLNNSDANNAVIDKTLLHKIENSVP